MNTVGASWLAFVPLLALVLYILAMLGVLWLAVRVVRHAWYLAVQVGALPAVTSNPRFRVQA